MNTWTPRVSITKSTAGFTKRSPNRPKTVSQTLNGFTLLELLVVITIISILFTFSTLALRTSSPEELIKKEAHRLDRLIQLALEETILKNTEYGLLFNTNGYQFLSYDDESGEWLAMEDDKQFRARELPFKMEIELTVEETDIIIDSTNDSSANDELNQNDLDQKPKPQVFLLSSEEITPEFSARFLISKIKTSYIVSGTIDGKHAAEKSEL